MSSSCAVHYDATTRTWFGPCGKDFYGAAMTLGEVTMRMLKLNADKVLQVCDTTGEQLTGAQLAQQGRHLALAFKRLGLRRGDVLGISANNTRNLTGVVIGAMLMGTPLNPLHPDFDQETVLYMYNITTPKLIFCDVENYATIKSVNELLTERAQIYLVNGHIEGVPNVEELINAQESVDVAAYVPCPKLTGDDTAFIVCSSGTTGMPKAVTRSHSGLLRNCKNPTSWTRNTILLSFSPLYWLSGTIILLASLLNGCQRIITSRPFSVDYLLQIVAQYRVTFLFSASHQIAMLAQSDRPADDIREQLSSIQVLIGTGSKVAKTVSQRMYELIGNTRFIVGYGLSEMGGISKNVGGPLGSEGKIMRNVEVRVLDKLNTPLGLNEAGIVHARLRHKWAGYYRNPEATKRALSADGKWFRTGDIGYLDSEGYLYIETRDTDVFKYNNFQIYPEQIEEYVLQLPGVREACIFGVPNLISTNLTACAVVRAPTEQGSQLTAADVVDIVARHLNSAYHLKGGVYFLDALPKTTNDKLQRRKVWQLIKTQNPDLQKLNK